jgi:thiol-disulfide isomerase/thioredoxin
MKKKLVLAAALLIQASFLMAQVDSTAPAYKRYPTIPPFTLVQTDSTQLTKQDLPKHKQTLVMFFSPDCNHCQHQTEDMLADIDKLKNIEIVMATYQPFEEMVAFYKKYALNKYSNIKLGRDDKYFLPPFFRMQSLPYLALYDKKGKLVTTFEGNVKVDKLVKAFEQ